MKWRKTLDLPDRPLVIIHGIARVVQHGPFKLSAMRFQHVPYLMGKHTQQGTVKS